MAVTTHFVAGTGVLALMMQGMWSIFAPAAQPIVVHSITYDSGYIVQDRTVNSDGPFKAFWTAEIMDASTGTAVPGCSGSGIWDYPSGRRATRIPIAEWVGNDACDLGPGSYIPIATYEAGEFREVVRGDAFGLQETRR